VPSSVLQCQAVLMSLEGKVDGASGCPSEALQPVPWVLDPHTIYLLADITSVSVFFFFSPRWGHQQGVLIWKAGSGGAVLEHPSTFWFDPPEGGFQEVWGFAEVVASEGGGSGSLWPPLWPDSWCTFLHVT
jgi:hypothetical protein